MQSVKFLLALASVSASAAGIQGRVHLHNDFWFADCRNSAESHEILDCDLPQSAAPAQDFSLTLATVSEPGQAGRVFKDIVAPHLRARLTLYSVLPALDTQLPPYIQIRIELHSPVRAACLQSVRWVEPFAASPVTCAGYDPSQLKEWGLNLKVQSE